MKQFILSNLIGVIVPVCFLMAGLAFIWIVNRIENKPKRKSKVIDLEDLDVTERFYQN